MNDKRCSLGELDDYKKYNLTEQQIKELFIPMNKHTHVSLLYVYFCLMTKHNFKILITTNFYPILGLRPMQKIRLRLIRL